jgi:hypothetical protein
MVEEVKILHGHSTIAGYSGYVFLPRKPLKGRTKTEGVDKETFSQGIPFAEYTDSSEFLKAYYQVSLSREDQEFFSSFNLKVLCISEEWCKDCKREVPFIAYVSDRAHWEMKIFKRDENSDLMDEYTTSGTRRIPVFVFFTTDFDEVGRFIEKPPEGKTTLQVLKEILKERRHCKYSRRS